MSNIDLNRGVTIRRQPTTGVQVFMYKDTPGVFLNAHGTEVDPELAKSAGFNTEALLKDKLKRERMAVAMSTIEEEFSSGPAMRETVREADGFKLIAVGLGRHKVLDPDGEELHDKPLTLEEANLLLDQLTHTAPGEAVVELGGPTIIPPTKEPTPDVVVVEVDDLTKEPDRYASQPSEPVYPKKPLAHVKPKVKAKGGKSKK